MVKQRDILIPAIAIFSLFFGAGNLILPPYLGFHSGQQWWLVGLGFACSAVWVPVLGILAHARLQGTLFDFGKKVSSAFSLIYCVAIYAISIALPSPRTAAVTHEMAIAPFWNVSPVISSTIYFTLVMLCALNRNRLLDTIGKWLSPALIAILALMIGATLLAPTGELEPTDLTYPLSFGMLEGYQTFDAIGAVVVGGVILVSLKINSVGRHYKELRAQVAKAGWLAGMALFLIYFGLIYAGVLARQAFDAGISRTALLSGISELALGYPGRIGLSVLVSLACFTTAVGIVTGTADFISSRFPNTQWAYPATVFIGGIIGLIIGGFEVAFIIELALPALFLIYPLTIVLIVLNIVPQRYASPLVFRAVVITALLFSIPDFMESLGLESLSKTITPYIPLEKNSLGWVLPSLAVFILCNLIQGRIRPLDS